MARRQLAPAAVVVAGAKPGKYTIGVILVSSPVSFAYFPEYLAISKEDCEISLVSFDTNEYTLAPPLSGH
jgi:hypothetical protein